MDPKRIVVASCGTKTGKTFGLCIWLTMQAWNRYQSLNWWTAPTYKQCDIAWKTITQFIPKGRYKLNRADWLIELLRTNGDVHSRIQFRSADNPESLRGEGVHACVVDEAAYWSYDSFVSAWTTLTRTRGLLRIISTPKGKNWFWEQWCKGGLPELAAKNPEYSAYRLPTHSNPFIPRVSLEEAERQLPRDVFRQEYLAEFLDDSAGVFRNISACRTAQLRARPITNAQYVMGIDWAKHEDYTVFVIMDRQTKEVVHIERHNGVDWNINIDRAIRTARFWNNAHVLMDSTGVGDVPFDSMKASYPFTDAYNLFNNAQKVALIQNLQFAFEKQQLALPVSGDGNGDILRRELEIYGYTMSSTGKFLFSAPLGYHDDTVMALALAYWESCTEPLAYRFRQVRY